MFRYAVASPSTSMMCSTSQIDDARARLLRAAVGFALVPATEPELRVLHQWLDCWRGVGDMVTGMNRQGCWLHLLNVNAGTWRATFSLLCAPQ